MQCKECGKVFVPVKRAVFCSEGCRKEYKRKYSAELARLAREREKEKLGTRECDICGKEFKPRYLRQVSCSKECQKLRHSWSATLWQQQIEEKSRRIPDNVPSIAETARKAREAGLSYGMYVFRYQGKEIVADGKVN